ncbi:MAG TPA: D-glycerate dehydrogenase [Chloroflexota bacterium]
MAHRPSVFVSRQIPEKAIEMLASHFDVDVNREDRALSADELRVRLQGKAGLACLLHDRVSENLLASVPTLRIVSNVAVGYDNIDLTAATRQGVMCTNTPDVLTDTTADFAFALLTAAARRVVEADGFVRAGKFTEFKIDLLLGQDVHHATIGLIGLGRIGRAMARRCRGFDMRVLYHQRHQLDRDEERELGVTFATKEQVLSLADFLSLHVPLTPETRHLIGAAELALMKPTAILINTSRGAIVDELALVDALTTGRIGGAALDVFEQEPQVHPALLGMSNVVLAPHIGSASHATRERMATLAAENCIAALTGQRPPNLLNPEVLIARA